MTTPLLNLVKRSMAILLLFVSTLAISQTDFLFIVDNSGSIDPMEFAQFASIIEATGAELDNRCANSEFAIVHYGGSFGQEYTIQNDFIPWNSTTAVNRVYVDCVTSGTGDCGDDLHAAYGHIDSEWGSGLNPTSGNDLIVVDFTDADGQSFAGVNMSPCTFSSCSTLLPTTNFDNFVISRNVTSAYVVAVAGTANGVLLSNYVYGDGTYFGINLNDDPNVLAQAFAPDVDCQVLSIGLAKNLTSVTNNNDGTFDVTYELNFENFSNVALDDLVLTDDIVSQFAGFSPTNFTAFNGSYAGNSSWNGTGGSNILAAGQSIGIGGTGSVNVQFTISHNGSATSVDNTATITGTADDGEMTTDDSTDGLDPDPNGDDDPEEDDPTPTPLPEVPMIGLAKDLTSLTNNMDGTYTIQFLFTVENFSTFALSNLTLYDDIFGQFGGLNPMNFMAINGSLNGSPAWNGTGVSNILAGGQSITAGSVETVSVSFDITPTGVMSTIFNTATVSGQSPDGQTAEDDSYDGLDPDPNGDGDPEEDMPTPVVLPEFSMISGKIWKDLNYNGLQDANENGVFWIKMELKDCAGNTIATSFTDQNGDYSFSNVYPGSFIMVADLSLIPPGCGFTLPNIGANDAIDSDLNQNGSSSCFDIVPGDNMRIDGGLYPPGNIGLAKALIGTNANADGTMDVEFLFTIENFSSFALTDLVLTDDFENLFAPHMPSNFMAIDGSLTANNAWDGTGGSNMLEAGQDIAAGAKETVSVTLRLLPDGISTFVDNQATVSAKDPNDETIEDDSMDGLDPDPNGNDNPEEMSPTPTPLPVFGKIGDLVWEDCNGDGRQGFGEMGIPNVLVKLYDYTGTIVSQVPTNGSGNYEFSQVRPGIYYLEFDAPSGYDATTPNNANQFFDSNVDGSFGPNTTGVITVGSGECVNTVDAGFYECIPIGDQVFYDSNRNDLFDTNENGINGILVELHRLEGGSFVKYAEAFTAHRPGTASGDGYFKFCAPPGNYRVVYNIPPVGLVPVVKNANGYQALGTPFESSIDSDINSNAQTDIFSVMCGYEVCNIGAGFYPMGQFGNRVWLDSNADGLQNGAEPGVAGVMINAYDSDDNMVGQAVTDASGTYVIDYLGRNDYYLSFDPPAQYSFTLPDSGADNMDSDVDGSNGPGTTTLYSIEPGDNLDNIDAGLTTGVVPVEWISFEGQTRAKENYLQWKVASEVNTSHYEVQRSLNAYDEFESIGSMAAAGNSSSIMDYHFSDKNIQQSGSYFYRLKQVDLDGAFSYSKTISLRREREELFSLFPNPFVSVVNIEKLEGQFFDANIYDVSGKLIMNLDAQMLTELDQIKIDLTDLPSGVYTLKGMLGSEAINKKLIKQ